MTFAAGGPDFIETYCGKCTLKPTTPVSWPGLHSKWSLRTPERSSPFLVICSVTLIIRFFHWTFSATRFATFYTWQTIHVFLFLLFKFKHVYFIPLNESTPAFLWFMCQSPRRFVALKHIIFQVYYCLVHNLDRCFFHFKQQVMWWSTVVHNKFTGR